MSKIFIPLCAGILLAMAGATGASAWAETALSGRLTDPQGAAVAGAVIRLMAGSGTLVA